MTLDEAHRLVMQRVKDMGVELEDSNQLQGSIDSLQMLDLLTSLEKDLGLPGALSEVSLDDLMSASSLAAHLVELSRKPT